VKSIMATLLGVIMVAGIILTIVQPWGKSTTQSTAGVASNTISSAASAGSQ
jgi:hypothetical protein